MLKPLAAAAALLVAACSSPPGPKISAEDAWARETAGGSTGAAYVTIANKGGADELVGVRATIGQAMLHESRMEDGIMRMRAVPADDGLIVPSNGKLSLAPGGAHVMLTGLDRPLKAGDRFRLTLLFDKARPETVTVEVRGAAE